MTFLVPASPGWGAIMDWKHDEPAASGVQFNGFAKLPLSCRDVASDEVGVWSGTETAWIGSICSSPGHRVLIDQQTRTDSFGYARTLVRLWTDRFVEFDPRAARVIEKTLEDSKR